MDRSALIARAKAIAIPVTSCVAARLRPDHLLRDATRDELAALVIVLAEAADPVTLRLVVEAAEDGPVVTDRDVMLLKAHAEAVRLRKAGQVVPQRLRLLDNEYTSRGRKPAPRPGGVLAQIRHDEKKRGRNPVAA